MWTAALSFIGGMFKNFKFSWTNPLVILGSILGAIFLIWCAVNFTTVAGWFGYETREALQQTVQEQKQSIEKAVDANASGQVTIKLLEEKVVEVQKSVERIEEQKIVVKTKLVKINKKRIEKIKTVEDKKLPPVDEAEKISEIQIDSIWTAYCDFNPEVHECVSTDRQLS